MDKTRLKSFVGQIYGDMAGAMTAGLGYVGVQTGLFKAMASRGMMSVDEVTAATGLQRRYVDEWLRGMVCAGYLEFDPDNDTFALPDEHAYLLASEGTDHFAGALFAMAPALLKVAPKVVESFRHGGGVSFEDFGDDAIDALAGLNEGNYEHKLVNYWLQAMPHVIARLESDARVLDVGCGTGKALLTLARSYSNASFTGIDLSTRSIQIAEQAAREMDLSDHLNFQVLPIQDLSPDAEYDLILAFDCVHDFSEPVKTLTEIRNRLAPDGTFFVIEPRAADSLQDNVGPVGTMFYGYSVFHCMTQSLANGGPGLGTCMGPRQTESLMRDAGFTKFRQLDIKSKVNLFYEVN